MKPKYQWLIVSLLVFSISFTAPCVKAQGAKSSGYSDHVLFFSGGATDDYVSYILLTTMDGIDLKGVVLTNADTITAPAMELQWKITTFLKDSKRPIALSNARGWNPFPWEYRADSIHFNRVESLAPYAPNPNWPPYPSGEALIKNVLEQAISTDTPVTILVTCPITALTDVLMKAPELEKGIRRIVFMGGAVKVPGNLDPNTIPKEIANDKAEWNIFWDPYAVDWLFKNTTIPIVLFPLDVTNQAKLKPLLSRLEQQSKKYAYSKLVYDGYELVLKEPFYCMWNVVTTCYISHPEFFGEAESVRLRVVQEGYEQGAILLDPNGREVQIIQTLANPSGFYGYILDQLRR